MRGYNTNEVLYFERFAAKRACSAARVSVCSICAGTLEPHPSVRMCVCVCVCVHMGVYACPYTHTHTHTHTQMYVYIHTHTYALHNILVNSLYDAIFACESTNVYTNMRHTQCVHTCSQYVMYSSRYTKHNACICTNIHTHTTHKL